MSSFPYFPLLLLGLCLLVTQRCSAEDSDDLSKITWINSLATKAELDAYLNDTDTHGMAKEVLSLKKTSKRYREDKIEVVMGSKPDGLTLAACLDEMKAKKKTKKLLLVVPSLKIYKETVKLLTAEVAEGNWITLSALAFKGPNGDDPAWTPEEVRDELANWPKHVNNMFGMTTKYVGTEGYSREVMDQMALDWSTSWVNDIPELGFSMDVFHISKTSKREQMDISELLFKVKHIEFFLSTEKQADVDVYKFLEYYYWHGMDTVIKKSYLNVPDEFRQQWNAVTPMTPPTEEPDDTEPSDEPTTVTNLNIETVPTQRSGCERVHVELASIVIVAILMMQMNIIE